MQPIHKLKQDCDSLRSNKSQEEEIKISKPRAKNWRAVKKKDKIDSIKQFGRS